MLGKGKSPLDVAVALESFEALDLKFAERISTKLRMQISQRVLHGSFLDLLGSSDLNDLERKIQKYCLDFARDFLRCTCKESPYCGCAQKNISLRILELRAEGKSPEEIIDEFSDKYGMYAYQGDMNKLAGPDGALSGGHRDGGEGARQDGGGKGGRGEEEEDRRGVRCSNANIRSPSTNLARFHNLEMASPVAYRSTTRDYGFNI